MSILKGISSIEDFELEGQNVFLRLDLNVPMNGKQIADETRIQAALPTLRYALDKGARLVIASHFGRPEAGVPVEEQESFSLAPVGERLSELLNVEILMIEDPRSDAPKALLSGLKRNQVVMLENLRFDVDETKNGLELANAIAEYTDIYINDAFGASHRAHCSIVGVPKDIPKKGIGLLMKKEIEMLGRILEGTDRPYVTVFGGSKVSDKIPLIEKLIDKVDTFIVGGAMAYTFLKAKNIGVGESRVEADQVTFCRDLLKRIEARGKQLLLPVDHKVVQNLESPAGVKTTSGDAILPGWLGVDIGPKSIEAFNQAIQGAKMVFWNGPMGIFEVPEFASGSFGIAKSCSESSAMTIVGGGDSASAAKSSGFSEGLSHISTGGGASLEYLQGLSLPGVEALRPPKRSETGEGEVYRLEDS